MWEDGWKQRYYKTKFDVDVTDEDFRKKVVRSYVEGLCWVLRYYYQVRNTSPDVLSDVFYVSMCPQTITQHVTTTQVTSGLEYMD